jgi:ribonuclease P protein component
MSGLFSFSKKERLSSKKLIRRLFKEGNSFYHRPFKVFYLENDDNEGQQVELLISVSRRYFRKAVSRNYIKRLIRESYRLNKAAIHEISSASGAKYAIGIIYVDQNMPDFESVQKRIIEVISRLHKEINKKS